MHWPGSFLAALILATSAIGGVLGVEEGGSEYSKRGIDATVSCKQIASAISSQSGLYWPGSIHYMKDVSHWARSSSDSSTCAVEPGNVEDLGKILQILGRNRTPFAVKGGGHTANPGFSSTPGVHIAMFRFSEINYDATLGTVDIGAGLVWDDVYAALEPHGINVVGGRVTGVGVAGFTLGGGYSWLSNERGLTIDNVVAFDLVLPSGEFTTVTEYSNPDLFWGLKGGFNNFGVVTKFTMRAFPQGDVWGGLITITGDHLDAVNAATAKFASTVQDPKAAIITTYNFLLGQAGVSQLLFYNGPTPPAGIFDDFLAIPHFTKDVSTRPFTSLILSSPANATSHTRGLFNTVSVTDYSDNFLKAVVNETKFWGKKLSLASATFISYDIEPFLPSAFSQAIAGSAAYPPNRRHLLPTNIYYSWLLSLSDNLMFESIKQSTEHLSNVAIAEGQDISDLSLYGNYAVFDTPLENIYGGNLDRLRSIKNQYDPNDIMGLSGGWKF